MARGQQPNKKRYTHQNRLQYITVRVGMKIFAFVFVAKVFAKFTFRFREIFVTKERNFREKDAKFRENRDTFVKVFVFVKGQKSVYVPILILTLCTSISYQKYSNWNFVFKWYHIWRGPNKRDFFIIISKQYLYRNNKSTGIWTRQPEHQFD
jgi:hypothetical protein